MQGKIQKTADIFSNDPKKERVTLRVQGLVKSIIEVAPSNIVFFQGMADQFKEESIELIGGTETFHVQKVESNLNDQIAYQMETIEDGKRYRLKISNKLKQGNYNGFVKVFTDHPKKPEVLVRVNGVVTGEISVRPLALHVGKLDSNTQQPPRKGVVAVLNNRDKPFKIVKLMYDEQLIDVTQKPIAEKQGFSLEITPKMEGIPKGEQRQIPLVVETDANPQEKYTVQVYLYNR
jgi:hypothetical protein